MSLGDVEARVKAAGQMLIEHVDNCLIIATRMDGETMIVATDKRGDPCTWPFLSRLQTNDVEHDLEVSLSGGADDDDEGQEEYLPD